MKRRPIAAILSVLCLALVCICLLPGLFNEQPVFQSYAFPLKVNAVWYTGKSPVLGEDGTIYLPLNSLSKMLDIAPPAQESGSASFNGYAITAGKDGVISCDGALYASMDALRALGLNAYYNQDSVSYVDNFVSLDYTWAENNRTVAHAMGGYDGHTYINSLEAFLYNYELGHRVFEVDFRISADNVLVAAHEWRDVYLMQYRAHASEEYPYPPLTVEEFTGEYLLESQTALTIDNVVELMIEYPDIYIITDTKETMDTNLMYVFEEIVSAAEYYDPSILNRIIPQIYSFDMYQPLFELYDWKSAIFTMYQIGSSISPSEVFDFTYSHGIKAITAPFNKSPGDFCRSIDETGGYVYLHTYNTLTDIASLAKSRSIYGVYTDFLPPDALDGFPDPLVIPQEAIDAEAEQQFGLL